MEGYLGKGHEVKNGHCDVPLTSESLVYGPAKEGTQKYDMGCFKAYVVSFNEVRSWQVPMN